MFRYIQVIVQAVAAIGLCVVLPCAHGQQPRLQKEILPTGASVLADSRARLSHHAQDLGAVSPAELLQGITLVFSRSPAQQTALDQLLRDQQNPNSAQYHQWLSPETFGNRFGMAESDLTAVQQWLRSSGFQVIHISRAHDRITFSGSAEQVRQAFGAQLHHYLVNGEQHLGPASDLSLPETLAPVVAAVLHLSDFRPQPSLSQFSPSQSSSAQIRPAPAYTTLTTQTHYLTPGDLAVQYDFRSLAQSFKIGSGQSIAVVGQSFVDTSFNSAAPSFLRALQLQSGGISPVLVPNSGVQATSPGDELESELDLEYAAGTAQGAKVFLVYVGAQPNYSVFDALTYAIAEKISPIISVSYGVCEAALNSTEINQANAMFAQAAAQGQTIVAASGDQGSTACNALSTASGLTTAQLQAPAVSFPASSPNVTAVGGTQMAANTFAPGPSSFWAGATGSDTATSLLSYVPEVVWNEGSVTTGIAAGGGGFSAVFQRPSWQSGVPGIPAGTARALPDIALQASVASPGFLFCSQDPYATSYVSPAAGLCLASAVGSGTSYPVLGGTSFSAPIFAGMLAILNQTQNSAGQGNVNPTLYNLASQPAVYAAAFHDITSGTNACVTGAQGCSAEGHAGFAAGTGYDQATGLGSIDLAILINAWPTTPAAQQMATISLFTIPYTAAPGESLPTTITVGATYSATSTLIPTGTLSLSVDGVVVNPALPFTSTTVYSRSSAANYTFTAPATPGSHLFTATYSGDKSFAPSTQTNSVLVGNVKATGNFTLAAGNFAIARNATGHDPVTLTPGGGYTGRVLWTLTSSAPTGAGNLCYLINPLLVNGVSTATLTVGSGTACNSPLVARLESTPSSIVAATPPGPASHPLIPAIAAAGALLAWRRRKSIHLPRLAAGPLLLTLAALVISLSGCGGAKNDTSSPPITNPPVSTAVTYTLKLQAQDSVNNLLNNSTTFTLTVN